MFLLRRASLLLFAAVFAAFGLLSPKFLEAQNLVNILIQSSSIAITAIGMTFVLLTAGIDLSVGSVMFITAVVAGKIVLSGQPLPLAIAAVLLVGLACGAINAALVTRLAIPAFIVTLMLRPSHGRLTISTRRRNSGRFSQSKISRRRRSKTKPGSERQMNAIMRPLTVKAFCSHGKSGLSQSGLGLSSRVMRFLFTVWVSAFRRWWLAATLSASRATRASGRAFWPRGRGVRSSPAPD